MKVDAEKLFGVINDLITLRTEASHPSLKHYSGALRECFVEEPAEPQWKQGAEIEPTEFSGPVRRWQQIPPAPKAEEPKIVDDIIGHARIFCLYCSSQVKDVHRPGCEAPAEGTFKAPAKAEECECGHPREAHGAHGGLGYYSKANPVGCSGFRPRVPQGEGAEPEKCCTGINGSHTNRCESKPLRLKCWCCLGTFPSEWTCLWGPHGSRCFQCEGHPICCAHEGKKLEDLDDEFMAEAVSVPPEAETIRAKDAEITRMREIHRLQDVAEVARLTKERDEAREGADIVRRARAMVPEFNQQRDDLVEARAEIQKLTEERDAQKNRADTYQAFAEARRPMDWQRLVTDRDEAIKGLSLALAEAQGDRDAAKNENAQIRAALNSAKMRDEILTLPPRPTTPSVPRPSAQNLNDLQAQKGPDQDSD